MPFCDGLSLNGRCPGGAVNAPRAGSGSEQTGLRISGPASLSAPQSQPSMIRRP
ncbi:MAG: hypothetical protein AVDCRST_MAG61-188 [uncultured Friedmanniella sp.]|uniref:Uncharacterized protein n=1 Tax=uncultured Friedmanniella sp. TaxID=335381 RepID=A0A6J4JZ58_9ACTN|nr:MAG: hypothetical protein AVDCRST_MAG61-188 [uncultured Friedmanniella sp.]